MNYDIEEYSKEGALNPGLFLVVVTAYLSRFMFYGPLSFLGSVGARSSSGGELNLSLLRLDSPFDMLTSIPALVILFIMLSRSSESSNKIRKIWSHGRSILLGTAIVQLALFVYYAFHGNISELTFAAGGINVFMVLYLFTSPRVKDVFSMFPQPTQDK